jgi:hypothetical protein
MSWEPNKHFHTVRVYQMNDLESQWRIADTSLVTFGVNRNGWHYIAPADAVWLRDLACRVLID